jgi:hypothetical protein
MICVAIAIGLLAGFIIWFSWEIRNAIPDPEENNNYEKPLRCKRAEAEA